MRRLIDGDRKTAKSNTIKALMGAVRRPTADKLAKLKSGPDSNPVIQGAQQSGMKNFLPSVGRASGMEHQRLKLGEVKKKKDEDEE